MKERQNASKLQPKEIDLFIQSILDLKKAPSRITFDTGFLPKPTNRYDDYVFMHVVAFSQNENVMVAHQRPTFLSWHRIYLAKFERDLQKLDSKYSDVTIPYWDWTEPNSVNKIFNREFLGGSGREEDGKVMDGRFAFDNGEWELYTVPALGKDFGRNYLTRKLGFLERNGIKQNYPLPTLQQVKDCLKNEVYDMPEWNIESDPSFRNYLEGFIGPGLHGTVHIWVGGLKNRITIENGSQKTETIYRGTMSAGDSPNDPIFWMHHSNIDRIWADWQLEERNWMKEYRGYMPVNSNIQGINVNDALPPWFGTSKSSNVVNFYVLGYRYNQYYRNEIKNRDEPKGIGTRIKESVWVNEMESLNNLTDTSAVTEMTSIDLSGINISAENFMRNQRQFLDSFSEKKGRQ